MDANGMDPRDRISMAPAERGRRVARALEVSVTSVYANEREAETLGPIVDAMEVRYGEISKGMSFADAGVAARGELVAEAIAVAEELAEARAVARCRRIVETATLAEGSDAEGMRRLLLAALDPTWDKVSRILSRPQGADVPPMPVTEPAAAVSMEKKVPTIFVAERALGAFEPSTPYRVRDGRDDSLTCRTWRGTDAVLLARLLNEEVAREV